MKFSRKLYVNMIKNKKRKNSSARWLQRHLNDQFVISSKKLGFRSRAAFKLIEINEQFGLITKDSVVLDLGAAPGSWSQVVTKLVDAQKILDNNRVVSVDLINIEPISGVHFIQGDIHDQSIIDQIFTLIPEKFDLIMSDMSPNTSGHASTDHLKIIELAEVVLDVSKILLKQHGHMIIKIFQGSDEVSFINNLKECFAKVKRFKPKASRNESAEIYVIAENFVL